MVRKKLQLGEVITMVLEATSTSRCNPTHVVMAKEQMEILLDQYDDMVNSDYDKVYQDGKQEVTKEDLENYLGVKIMESDETKEIETKVFAEITPNTEQSW